MNREQLFDLLRNMMVWQLIGFLSCYAGMSFIAPSLNQYAMKLAASISLRKGNPREKVEGYSEIPAIGGIGIILVAVSAYITIFILNPLAIYIYRRADYQPWPVSAWKSFLPLFTVTVMIVGLTYGRLKRSERVRFNIFVNVMGQLATIYAFIAVFLALQNVIEEGGFRSNLSFEDHIIIRHMVQMLQLPPYVLALLSVLTAGMALGISKSVRIADDMNGLAAGLCVQAGLAFYVLKLSGSNWWLCLAGACLGFVTSNFGQVQARLGYAGSFALGFALGVTALVGQAVWLLPCVGFIFLIELSILMLQYLWFWLKCLFANDYDRAFQPELLHNWYIRRGWSERKIVRAFWTANACATLLGVYGWKVGILPRVPRYIGIGMY